MTPTVTALDHLVLTVADIGHSVAFYERIMGMVSAEVHAADGSTRTALAFGGQKINLHPAGREYVPCARSPVPGSADLCFLSDTPLDDWLAHLGGWGITVEQGPVARHGATGPITSIYFRDPDGNLIEVANPA